MAVYVFRSEPSTGARELAEALEAVRYRGLRMPIERKVRRGDVVVCWGEAMPQVAGVKVLNGAPLQNKYRDAEVLTAAGVPTINVSRVRPTPTPITDPAQALWQRVRDLAEEFGDTPFARTDVYRQGADQLHAQIQGFTRALAIPRPVAQVSGEWVGRMNNHVGGNDLLTPPTTPDFFVKKETVTQEFRIHSFKGKSIRAGVKGPREGVTQHAWVRSWDGGWKISYDGVTARQAQRDLAHRAVAALGLDFGAVDIGQKADGSLFVLEVNRAPGVENGTVESYARAIEGWLENPEG